MPRYVVLQHDPPAGATEPVHWDFMLEQEGVLATWALEAPPDTPGPIAARKLPDHRLLYLDYEGEISGGRGSVTRWDHGEWEMIETTDSELRLDLIGSLLRGEVGLRRQPSGEYWSFFFAPRSTSAS